MSLASALTRRATRAGLASRVGVVRALSAPPKGPPQPSPAELEKQIKTSEEHVREIREGTYHIVAPRAVSDVPDPEGYVPKDVSELAVLNEQPAEHRRRVVKIRQKCQNAMQSGTAKTFPWVIDWPSQRRWSNPLMGWTSTGDPLTATKLFFDTAEEAIRFAERQGWSYDVDKPIDRTLDIGKKKYAFNFLPEDVEHKLKVDGVKNKHFEQPGFSSSNWFMPLKYHGDGEVDQHGPSPEGGKKKKA